MRHHIERFVILGALAFGVSAGAQSVDEQGPRKGTLATISDAELVEFEARLRYGDPHVASYVIFEIITEQGRDRVEVLLRAGQIRRPSALWALQWLSMFAGDRFEAKRLTGEARKEHFRKALEYLQESYDATTRALEQARSERETQEEHVFEQPVEAREVLQLFNIALKNVPNRPQTDREVYDWLVDNPIKSGNYGEGIGSHVEHELPAYQTWLRGLRKFRNRRLEHAIPALQECLALAAVEAGELAMAKRHAAKLLKSNTDVKSLYYGRIIHNANVILGRVALREGDLTAAKRFLLRAGETPGGPGLNSFGPSMDLPRELLAKGERDAVIEYLDLIGKFWGQGGPNKSDERLSRDKQALLEQWKTEIRAGNVPQHRKWLGPGNDSKAREPATP